jgi:pimeloyl-ACP methyl ester carboxylesterase
MRYESMAMSISANTKISKLYEDVPEESLNRLVAFRERYPYRVISLGGRQWRFIDSGEGERVLFIPAGGTTIAEVSFNSLEHFAKNYRVIAPDYPPIEELQELFDGFIDLLDYLGVNQFYTMGGSYGGWMVQSLLRQYPERINKMVITAVGPPSSENSQAIARLMGWFRITPTFLLRWMINRSFSRLENKKSDDQDMALLWAQVREAVFFHLGRVDILAMLQRLIDQTENYAFSADDLKDWSGRILLVFGSDDPATPREKREAMVKLYPQAEVKVFEGGEHGIAITHQQEYFAVIDEFLAR